MVHLVIKSSQPRTSQNSRFNLVFVTCVAESPSVANKLLHNTALCNAFCDPASLHLKKFENDDVLRPQAIEMTKH